MDNAVNVTQVSDVVQEFLELQRTEPIDLLGIGDAAGEYDYTCKMRQGYVRTVCGILAAQPPPAKLLEIGPYLGIVALTLAKFGYEVSTLDLPVFANNPRLRSVLHRHGIDTVGLDLCSLSPFPYSDDAFDMIVMCEVLEHLNANPYPMIVECNRVLQQEGQLYIATPNATRLHNRLQMLFGASIHEPVRFFRNQLDPDGTQSNVIAGFHWREYTSLELQDLVSDLGFTVEHHTYIAEPTVRQTALKIAILPTLYRVFPSLSSRQVVIARKTRPARFADRVTARRTVRIMPPASGRRSSVQ
jgi:SAM-dependent methyltransferase